MQIKVTHFLHILKPQYSVSPWHSLPSLEFYTIRETQRLILLFRTQNTISWTRCSMEHSPPLLLSPCRGHSGFHKQVQIKGSMEFFGYQTNIMGNCNREMPLFMNYIELKGTNKHCIRLRCRTWCFHWMYIHTYIYTVKESQSSNDPSLHGYYFLPFLGILFWMH